MEFIKKHKIKFIIGMVILFVLMVLYLVWTMLPNASKSLYGNRLDGIEDVKIEKNDLSKVQSALKAVDGVKKINIDIKGRLINFNVNVNEGVDKTINENLIPIIIDNFSKEELAYYDLQLFINGKSEQYPVIGYKHKTSDSFVWSNNK